MKQHEKEMESKTIQKNEVSHKDHKSYKKIFTFVVFLLVFCSFTNKAIGQSWSLNNGTLTINDNSAFSTTPYPWANNISAITKLSIGSGVTSIPNGAFASYNNLTTVRIEDGIPVLSFEGSYFSQISAFENSPINNLYLGRNYTVGNSNEPFSGNTGLKNLTIGNTVTTIKDYGFENCTKLETVVIGNSVTSIGISAFQNCIGLSSVNIPNSITEISLSAFFGCASLGSLIIPQYVTSIGNGAFASCNNLTNVKIEDGTIVLSFEGSYMNQISAFKDSPINNLYLGRNYTVGNGNEPFSGNTGLKNLTIGNTVTAINDYSFENCTRLETVNIGSRVTSIGISTFQNCIALSSVNIPNSITEISLSAFFGCASLGSLIIPQYVTSIGNGAFASCNNLTNVKIEDGTIVLSFEGSYMNQISAFKDSPINNLYLGRNYTVGNGNEPFSGNTGLKNLTIGQNVTTINDNSFYNCTGLAQITSNATTPPTLQANTFYDVNKGIPVYIDCDYFAAYKSAQYWSDFTNYQCGSTPSLTVLPISYNFPANGGTSSAITVTSNQSWTVSSNVSWLTISQTSGINDGTFTMTAASNADSISRSATVTVTGGGITQTINVTQDVIVKYTISTSSNPSTYGSTSGGGTYNSGTSCTVNAMANTGYSFVNWTESGSIRGGNPLGGNENDSVVYTNAIYTFTVSADRSLVANFKANTYTVTLDMQNGTGGSASVTVTYDAVMPSATAPTRTNYIFGGYYTGINGTGTQYYNASMGSVRNWNIASATTLYAQWIPNSSTAYSINTSSNPTAGGSTSGSGTYSSGASCTVCATTNSGYSFSDWTENGSVISTSTCYTFTVSANRNLVANFESNGTGSPDLQLVSLKANEDLYQNQQGSFTATIKNNGNGAYNSHLWIYMEKLLIYYPNQSIDGGLFSIAAGETKTITISGIVTLPPDTYALNMIFDANNDPSNMAACQFDGTILRLQVIVNSKTGIETVSSNQISIYPNPVKNELFIKTDLTIKKVEISDLTGHNVKLLRSTSSQNGMQTISVSSLSKGIYLVKVYTDNSMAVSKIVKE